MVTPVGTVAKQWLGQEAIALLTRLDQVKPFALHETMVPAAGPPLSAQVAIERYLVNGRQEMRNLVARFLHWLQGPQGRQASATEAQRRFTLVRLRFNAVLSQFDIFADVITQRSEQETGVWLAGLDALAADALDLPGGYYTPPPVVCYLDRGHGAAIRRARTRLPGGGKNPVAVIRVPRERMVGSGVASSLVHEVGHQGAALLDLIRSLQEPLWVMQQRAGPQRLAWELWQRWISEILADFWSVARIGIGSTLGLISVVSLPRPFVFRVALDDPHPIPWIRARLSAAMGQALYPDRQWSRVAAMWQSYYPLDELDAERRQLLAMLEATMPDFVTLLNDHRPAALRGRSLRQAVATADRQPEHLRVLYQAWRGKTAVMGRAAPSLVFAVIGQARADGQIGPELESKLLSRLLAIWTLRRWRKAAAPHPTRALPAGAALAT